MFDFGKFFVSRCFRSEEFLRLERKYNYFWVGLVIMFGEVKWLIMGLVVCIVEEFFDCLL